MNAQKSDVFGNTLVIGAGPAGIHVAVDISRMSRRVGLLNRPGVHSEQLRKELEQHAYQVASDIQVESRVHLSGKVQLFRFYDNYERVEDIWDTIVLCTPSDSYLSVIEHLSLDERTRVQTIILLSPFIGSNLLVEHQLGALANRIEVVSLSTYYAASKFPPGQGSVLTSVVKGMKRKVTAGSNPASSNSLKQVQFFIEGLGMKCELAEYPLEAESRSITTYVHPPFFINEFSLNEIFSFKKSKKYMYKLHPEGPITKQAIRNMVLLWKEVSELLSHLNIKPINLLKFLNDDNYPVQEQSLTRDEIQQFPVSSPVEQEYLLYVRYSSLLIDPFSKPDENGKYAEFSAVPYKQISLDNNGAWVIPRIPYEDYRNIKLLYFMGEKLGIAMPQTKAFVQLFEGKLLAFMQEVEHCRMSPDLMKDSAFEQAETIIRVWMKKNGTRNSV